MKAVNQASRKVLDILTAGLTADNSGRRIDNNPPNSSIMAVNVDWIGRLKAGEQEGDLFAVSHTYEQNGDLMRDPEMEFLRAKGVEGHGIVMTYYPISFRQDNLGINHLDVVISQPENKITAVYRKAQADGASFANLWMKNIRQQQGLEVKA